MNPFSPIHHDCAICLDSLERNIVNTKCGHAFHAHCLTKAVLQAPKCPYCRTKFRIEWLLENDLINMKEIGILLDKTPRPIQNTSARETYWNQVEEELEDPPLIGPMLPSQQRWYNMEILEEIDFRPPQWSQLWISDRISEMRIRFNIGPDTALTARDVHICELNGILGVRPEWAPP